MAVSDKHVATSGNTTKIAGFEPTLSPEDFMEEEKEYWKRKSNG